MEKNEAIKLAVKLATPLLENEKLELDNDKDSSPKTILKAIENIAKGILEIEKKI